MASVEFPLSFTRQYVGPLDTTAVFATKAELVTYVTSDPTIAYAGQAVSVSTGADAGIYIISENVDSVQRQVGSEDVSTIVKLTQAEYDVLTPDALTLYVIVG
jgi:hypothetical protein